MKYDYLVSTAASTETITFSAVITTMKNPSTIITIVSSKIFDK
jgi:hypothetical protein